MKGRPSKCFGEGDREVCWSREWGLEGDFDGGGEGGRDGEVVSGQRGSLEGKELRLS